MALKISAFPKCYLDAISIQRTMTVFDWIEMAKNLDADGLEMYHGFFTSMEAGYLNSVGEAIHDAGFAMPMLCCSPDFTHPDAEQRKREVDRQVEMLRAAHLLGGMGTVCRVLSGQRHPGVDRAQGMQWAAGAIREILPVARELGVVLGMENHFKDGAWEYPEFAQKMDVFLELVELFRGEPAFGIQYDPSNAIVAGDDPLELLRAVLGRVVSVHASDRYVAGGELRHGVTGKGMNDYPEIFRLLSGSGYKGWISIEDGVNGMDEMAESLAFLRRMGGIYFS